jgi:hypothetical protein
MKTRLKTNGAPPGRRLVPAADERGFLLVMVMVVMLVVATMVASTLVNSFLERSLAKNQNYASVALQAGEGGLAAGLTWVRENQASLPNPYTVNVNWTQTLTRSLPSGGTYAVTMRFKREWRDVNGDGDCTDPGEDSGYKDSDGSPAANCPGDVVLYNKCSGADGCFDFPDSLYLNAGQGYPVIEIDSTAYFGTDSATASSFRQIALDIARNRVNVNVKGAVTARSNVSVGGSGYVDGHNFNEAGTATSASCADLPAITVAAGSDVAADCTSAANPPGGNPKGSFSSVAGCNDEAGVGLSKNPWDALGISESDFNDIFTATTTQATMPGTAADPAYVWQQGDLHVNGGNGYGILVVHNVHFDPDVFDVSDPDSALYNTADAKYDARADSSNAAYDATYGPAEFRMNGNCSFTGVIIADKILRVNGNATTVGAVISTGGVSVDGDITGNWSAKYSCDAIENALGGFGYGTKIAWHRLR